MGRIKFDARYLVVKLHDVHEHLTADEEDTLYRLLRKVERGRKALGKEPNQYVVVNRDESYAPEVERIMQAHGHCAEEDRP